MKLEPDPPALEGRSNKGLERTPKLEGAEGEAMAFVWKKFQRARDFGRNVIIKSAALDRPFDDVGPGALFPYQYSQGDVTFRFYASAYSDWRMFSSYSSTSLGTIHVGTYIAENSFRYAVTRSSYVGDYQELRERVRDGMLVLGTQGGEHLRFAPDFYVEFVDTHDDIPKLRPRPSPLDSVLAASLYEKRLALADKKNISFVYEDYGAEDVERNLTITRLNKFEEISLDDPRPYIFSQDDLTFEFRASTYREWRMMRFSDTPVRPHTATYVIEESIKRGFEQANDRALDTNEYETLKKLIKEGMWVAETRGERALDDVPDFRLEFVDTAEGAPRWPQRPST